MARNVVWKSHDRAIHSRIAILITNDTIQGRLTDLRILPAGDWGVLIEVDSSQVQGVAGWLSRCKWASWIDEIVPGHSTVLVMARAHLNDIAAAVHTATWDTHDTVRSGTTRTIDVAYGGPDFEEVCHATGLARHEVIAIHTGAEHIVSHFGFSPGFPYLTGLPERLYLPRRATPRASVEPNTLAIAAGLTIIYPGGTPGGWNLIGTARTPVFWDVEKTPPNLLSLGDRIIFREA